MKKPIYNMYERWQIKEIDCIDTALKKLHLSKLHLIKEITKTLKK